MSLMLFQVAASTLKTLKVEVCEQMTCKLEGDLVGNHWLHTVILSCEDRCYKYERRTLKYSGAPGQVIRHTQTMLT
jgi:hypothetical protein